MSGCISSRIFVFLSTLSLRRATGGYGCAYLYLIISIHALLAESDQKSRVRPSKQQRFLSTLSLRRATPYAARPCPVVNNFYPRSPCGERPATTSAKTPQQDFYPRSPCGERRYPHFGNSRRLVISIHALLAESDVPRRGI